MAAPSRDDWQRCCLLLVFAAGLVLAAVSRPAGAQNAPVEGTTTVEDSTTTSQVEETTTTASPDGQSTTTTAPVSTTLPPNSTDGAPRPSASSGPTLPEVVTDGSGRSDDGQDRDLDPGSFLLDLDGRSLAAVSALPLAQSELAVALDAVAAAQVGVSDATATLRRLNGRLSALSRRDRSTARAIDETTEDLTARAVAGYVAGPEARPSAWLSTNGDDAAVQEVFLEALAGSDADAIAAWRDARAAASASLEALSGDILAARRRSESAAVSLATAQMAAEAASARLGILQASGDVTFTFPVSNGVFSYSNDWGFPRSGGRRHEGTDIFGPRGTPLVAVEAGTITKVGTGNLGGNIVWLRGDSGHRYYYAHLDAFWPGVAVGTRMEAGAPLGRLGDTGNAKGTPTHLHFEIHPAGLSDPVNPYPVLRLVAEAMGAAVRSGGSTIVIGPGHAGSEDMTPWSSYTTTAPPAASPSTTAAAPMPAPSTRRRE